jgi:hypothetical protein
LLQQPLWNLGCRQVHAIEGAEQSQQIKSSLLESGTQIGRQSNRGMTQPHSRFRMRHLTRARQAHYAAARGVAGRGNMRS